ncbi:MAG: 4Fe-4S dicluster domain-containing protein [Deltaproteobacteria bacterium]|jgi:Fe-S oxidoreductase|nr:4Fe-4S dicluster domain-containing protein [Deltaproteobacteria bacterium]
MEQSVLEQFENLCTQEALPACQSHCPLQVDGRALASLTAEGKIDEARKNLERNMPLAAISGRVCEGPCREHCLRTALDSGVNIPLLELCIVQEGRPVKPFPLPGTNKTIAVVGSGLSGLVAAYGLAMKGHKPVILTMGRPGGKLWDLSRRLMPAEVIEDGLQTLKNIKVEFLDVKTFDRADLDELTRERGGVFLAPDDPLFDFSWLPPESLVADRVTRSSNLNEKIFLGPDRHEKTFLEAVSAGKKAALSLDRLFQGVNPATAREKEMTGPTRLRVDLGGREPIKEMEPKEPTAPDKDEAKAEAARCLRCACLACLPPCPLLRGRKGYPKKYAREFYNNIITAFGIRHSNRHINSCTECGLCAQLCPNGANLGQFVAKAKIEMVKTSHMPVSAHEFALEDQVFSNSDEAAFIRLQPGSTTSAALFFPGCQLSGASPEGVLDLYRHLMAHLPGGVGLWAGCCGAPGRWSGRRRLTDKTVATMAEVWKKSGSPTVILACPSCARFFEAELPDIPILGLWPVLEKLALPERAVPLAEPLVVHDPCAARLDMESQTSLRRLMEKLGQALLEPPMSGRKTLCCGYGGLVSEAVPEMGRQFVQERLSGCQEPILAWCSVCRDRFRAEGRGALHPIDLLFPQAPPQAVMTEEPPGISAKREGRRFFKIKALTDIFGEAVEETKTMGLNVDVPGSVLRDMESRRILMTDVMAVLENAAKNGPSFINQETGRRLANLRPRQVTYWVEYDERQDGSILVHRAWCHRMETPGAPGERKESPASEEGFARTGGRV